MGCRFPNEQEEEEKETNIDLLREQRKQRIEEISK